MVISLERFEEAIRAIPDDMFERIINYIDSGKQFIAWKLSNGEGRGCLTGVIGRLENEPVTNHLSNKQKTKEWNEYASSALYTMHHNTLALFNNYNIHKPILYQTLRKEWERRGKIKLEQSGELIIP